MIVAKEDPSEEEENEILKNDKNDKKLECIIDLDDEEGEEILPTFKNLNPIGN